MTDVDYPWIRRWGKHLGSFDYFIREQVALARKESAPPDAVYRGHDGRWRTASDIENPDTKEALGLD